MRVNTHNAFTYLLTRLTFPEGYLTPGLGGQVGVNDPHSDGEEKPNQVGPAHRDLGWNSRYWDKKQGQAVLEPWSNWVQGISAEQIMNLQQTAARILIISKKLQ